MNKQTAVEWLEQEFIALQNYGVNELGLFEKAKEMEKNQIKVAHKIGYVLGTNNRHTDKGTTNYWWDFEEYQHMISFKETFNK